MLPLTKNDVATRRMIDSGNIATLARLRSAIERNPEREANWLAYGEALAAQGEIATASALLEAARRNGLNSPPIQKLAARLRARLEAEHLLVRAIQHHQNRQPDVAIDLYRKALAGWPGLVEAELNLATALQETGAVADAQALLRKVVAEHPDLAVAHYNLGNTLALLDEDPRPAFRNAIALDGGYADAWYNLALAEEAAGELAEAEKAYCGAIAAKPDLASAHMNLGVLLFSQRRYDEALAASDRAIAAAPGLAAAHSNRGNVLRAQGAHAAAIDAYRAAIACDAGLAEAHNHLGNLLREEGRLAEAADCYRNAAAAAPDFAEPSYNLGYVLMEMGAIDEGFAHLTQHALLTCPALPQQTAEHKRLHDREQREHLGTDSSDPSSGLVLAGGGAVAGPAVARHSEIEAQWQGANPVVVIDDFLTPSALDGLRRFCNDSTIWREVYEGGYLGAFPEHGVACPLLAQIARELQQSYPRIFGSHPLLQIWAFKYGSRLEGIPLHADFAAINVNFWITPDEANLDPAHGGLVIWDKPAPLDWDFAKYNIDAQAGRRFLESQGAKSVTVPYRANRAVIFDSNLFHETDVIHFAPGYRNRRINITLLYGRRS
jgi:tetratricopeptide (TPR) repeat protein